MDKESLKGIRILETSLSARARNALSRHGIKFADELIGLTEFDLEKIRNLGKVSRDEVMAWMEQRGYPITRIAELAEDSRKTIEVKIATRFFEPLYWNELKFVVLKDTDHIMPGDTLILKEWEKGDTPHYTGRETTRTASYVLRNAEKYGVAEGFCVVGF